jgi:hypothetical protein
MERGNFRLFSSSWMSLSADNAYGFCCGCCLQNPMEQKPRDISEILLTEKNIHVAEL